MKNTIPVFVVGSGRSGTRMVFKLLSGIPEIEVHHEYCCTHIQPIAAKYFMGVLSKKKAKKQIQEIYGSAVFYSSANYFVDASNKASWIIDILHELFPMARFVQIIRDGRKVTASFYKKLSAEIYDDISVRELNNWIANPRKYPEPPPEKKYWWNIPQNGQPMHKEFATYSQFERICYHYTQVYRTIRESLGKVPKNLQMTVKLEDLTTKKSTLTRFLSVFDIPYSDDYFEFVQKPQGVFFPMDMQMSKEEKTQFERICRSTMKKLGYTGRSYAVKY